MGRLVSWLAGCWLAAGWLAGGLAGSHAKPATRVCRSIAGAEQQLSPSLNMETPPPPHSYSPDTQQQRTSKQDPPHIGDDSSLALNAKS